MSKIDNISNGIAKGFQSDDMTFYHAHCSCGDCEHTLSFEFDSEINDVTLTIYADVFYNEDYWYYESWYKEIISRIEVIWKRVKASFRILFTGHVKCSFSHIFEGEEQIEAYISAMKEGLFKAQTTPLPGWKTKKN